MDSLVVRSVEGMQQVVPVVAAVEAELGRVAVVARVLMDHKELLLLVLVDKPRIKLMGGPLALGWAVIRQLRVVMGA